MNKNILLSAIVCLHFASAYANSYEPLSLLERDLDFFAIGRVENIQDDIATLQYSHIMRNISRQPSKRRDKTLRIKMTSDEVKVGDAGIWALRSLYRSNNLFKAYKITSDYPEYERLAEWIREKEHIHLGSRWVGLWKSENGSIELYLGESGFGYIKTEEEVTHCSWSVDPGRPISVFKLNTHGIFQEYELLETVKHNQLYGRTTKTRFKKTSDSNPE